MKNIIRHIPLVLLTTLSISTLFIGSQLSTGIIVAALSGLTGYVYFLNTKETPDIRKEVAQEFISVKNELNQLKNEVGQVQLISKRNPTNEKIRF